MKHFCNQLFFGRGNKLKFIQSLTDKTIQTVLLCILTSFWVLCTPEAGQNIFLSPFNLFCWFQVSLDAISFSLAFRNVLLPRDNLPSVVVTDVGNQLDYVEKGSKSISTSFWVSATPKSWSKYTTQILKNYIVRRYNCARKASS